MSKDYTLKDNFRRDYSFTDNHQIEQVLPDYFKTEYPNLIKLLEYYYQFEDSDQAPSRLIHDIITNRDITAVDLTLLSFIEDELLLGQSYFEGFVNKRAAAKYSNTLYRSKGTLYSIEQFFRTFFGVTPDVRYTKEDRFMVGVDTSRIGSESQKFLTDDKLYQVFAILIKTNIPIQTWREAYKLFVHPAGMYFGGQVLLEGIGNIGFAQLMPDYIRSVDYPVVQGVATLTQVLTTTDLTGIVDSDGRGVYGKLRIDLASTVKAYQNIPLEEIDRYYDTIAEFIGTNSPTMDEDSVVGDARVARFDMARIEFDTMDEVKYTWYDSDSA
tara:strand:- start:1605 stop:2585 length:981 start_codon:yes stop_codon:yes gene_type:complete